MGIIIALLLAQTTPNMGLCTVTPGQTSVTATQNCLNTNAAIIDAHNHTSGQGVLVPVPGLNIQAPLPFNGQPATGMGYLGLVDAGAGPSVPITLWNDGVNWWVEDGAGNKIQLTKNGGINVVVGDGGSYSFTSITATSAVIDGWTIASGCLTGANGAIYCFDTAGGLLMTAVDGGQVLASDAFGDSFFEQGGVVAMVSNGGGEIVCNLTGCYTTNRLGLDSMYNGYIGETGTHINLDIPDGGAFDVTVGTGSTILQTWSFGATQVGRITSSGTAFFGTSTGAEAIELTPGAGGAGRVLIQVSASVDPDISIEISPKGDGGVILAGHIDSSAANAPVLDAGTNIAGIGIACSGTAVEYLSPNSTDTAGTLTMITARDGGSVGACGDENIVGVINFANVYDNSADFSISVTENDHNSAPLAIYVEKLTNGFAIEYRGTPTPNSSSTYRWDWITVGQGAGAH